MKSLYLSLIFILSCVLSIHAQTMEDGINYCKGGYLDEAVTTLEKSLIDPDTNKCSAYYYLGLSELSRGDSKKAQTYFSKCIENAGGSPIESLLASGALALINSDAKGANGYFKKAEKQDKGSVSVLREIGRLYVLAAPSTYNNEIDQLLTQCMKKGNGYQWAYALIKGDMTKDPGAAAAMYEMASSYNPNDFEAVAKYARLFEEVNPQYAIAAFQRYIQENPSASNKAIAEKLLKSIQER